MCGHGRKRAGLDGCAFVCCCESAEWGGCTSHLAVLPWGGISAYFWGFRVRIPGRFLSKPHHMPGVAGDLWTPAQLDPLAAGGMKT